MKWFFRISKIVMVVFILSCIARIAFVLINDSGCPDVKEKRIGYEGNVDSKDNEKKAQPEKGRQSGADNKENNTGNSREKSSSSEDGDYFLTSKEVGLINNISLTDKLKGLTILCKVKKEDFNRLISIVNGGITLDEFDELKLIFERNLCEKDIGTLNEIMLKNKGRYAEGKKVD